MRNMSFALTTEQVRARTKTVTRRLGWKNAKPGDVVQPVVKGMGLKKGETVEKIGGPIRFISVRREPLNAITPLDVAREGFGVEHWKRLDRIGFIEMFCDHNGGAPDQEVTRIEFEYTEPKA